jgi:hypothetical protein
VIIVASCKDSKSCKPSFELTESDFEDNPIWENCITIEKYQETGTTDAFTPVLDKVTIDPDNGYYLVAAGFEFADKSKYGGYVSPRAGRFDSTKISGLTPTIFVNNKHLALWAGAIGLDSLSLIEFYQTIGKKEQDIFPIVFYVDSKHQSGMQTGIINGIGYCSDLKCDSIKFIK